jgi:D-3-phosphoglycerate dehydrogenase / 2-oxoglutarate reductase
MPPQAFAGGIFSKEQYKRNIEMTKKILVATEKPFAPEAINLMKAAIAGNSEYELVLLEKYKEVSEFKAAVKNVDALIVRSDLASKEIIEAAENLKIIVRAGAGYDNIDLAAATAKNIVAMNTPGQNANAVAELGIGLMIMAARNMYNGKPGTEISGKKFGIYGYGAIGKIMLRYAKSIGMETFAYSRSLTKEISDENGFKYCKNLEELFSSCNYVSLHIPAVEETKKSINYELMSKMPKNATLVNTARKEIICEEGLKKMLAERKDFKYVSDIEPACAEELKKEYPDRVYFTVKKLGAQTEEANVLAGIAAVKQIVCFFEAGDRTFQVNK